MYALQEQEFRERLRQAEVDAAHQRLVNRVSNARRWQQLAGWAAHRAAMAQRASREESSANVPTN